MRRLLWALAILTAFSAARYFLDPPPFLHVPLPDFVTRDPVADVAPTVVPHAYSDHRALFLTHVACGIAAILLGLLQFRARRGRVHRTLGLVYCAAVLVGTVTAFPLSFVFMHVAPESLRGQFFVVTLGFLTLSIAWPFVTAMAFIRARQRRFDDHRAWMIRSYSLTFAAATTRLAAPLILVATSDMALSVQGAIWTWPLNLVVAEWLIRRTRPSAVLAPVPSL